MTRIKTTLTIVREYDADPEHYMIEGDDGPPSPQIMTAREQEWILDDPISFVDMEDAALVVRSEVIS